ncbi:MAG: sugar phosphate nucleotidyltransferase [Bryobacteraceae bacterium]
MDAILLAGGLGTRLQPLFPELPKAMAPVAGQPFLHWVLRYWKEQGASRIVLSIGHRAEIIEAYAGMRPPNGLRLEVVREEQPLGTGGALRFAAVEAGVGDPFAVANADSLVLADLAAARRLLESDAKLDGVVAGVEVSEGTRFGTLDISADGLLRGFLEKRPGAGIINAGIYLFRRRILDRFPTTVPLSVETQVFPTLLEAGARIAVFRTQADFLDMGTPESFRLAADFIRRHFPA